MNAHFWGIEVLKFKVFVASVIAVSILGFLIINSTRDNDERVNRNYFELWWGDMLLQKANEFIRQILAIRL